MFRHMCKRYRIAKLLSNGRFVDYNFSIRLFFFSNMQAGRALSKNLTLSFIPPMTGKTIKSLTNWSSENVFTNGAEPIKT